MNKKFSIAMVLVILFASTLACRLTVGVGDQLVTKNPVRLVAEFSASPTVVCTVPEGATVTVESVSKMDIGGGDIVTVVYVSHRNCLRGGWALMSHFK